MCTARSVVVMSSCIYGRYWALASDSLLVPARLIIQAGSKARLFLTISQVTELTLFEHTFLDRELFHLV